MSFTSSFLQLDGIEFKISDSLQTPNFDYGLPSNFRMNNPSGLLLESEYDFSKEKQVLEKINAVREAEQKIAEQEEKRKQQSLKRRADADKQRLEEMMIKQREVLQRKRELFLEQKRKQKENAKNGEISTPERVSPSEEPAALSRTSPTSENVSEVPPPIPPRNPFLQVGKDDILTPQPAARKNQDSSSPSHKRLNESQPVVTGQNQIWVDFEDKELDPFTNMELKTIDDMAELQSVLQNVKLDPPPSFAQTSAEKSDHLPSYNEATSPTYGNLSTPPEASSTPNGSPELTLKSTVTPQKTDPLLDVEAISFTMLNSRDKDDIDVEEKEDTQPIYENASRVVDNVITSENVPERKSPEFVMPENPETLYENVNLSQVQEIAKKLNGPNSSPTNNQSPTEPLYDFANEATPSSKGNKPANTQSENLPANPALYSVVRPKSRPAKTPDVVSFSSVQSLPAEPHSSSPVIPALPGQFLSQQPSSDISPPVQPRQTRSRPELVAASQPVQINTVFPPPNQYASSGGAKVLPVSFGAVSNPVSSNVLPPITSANEGTFRNLNPGSRSAPNLTQAPVPMPRKPPVPPRDPIVAATHAPHPPPSSSPNGPKQPVKTTGHSHLLPPYALPQANGPSITQPSTTPIVEKRRPSPPPPKVTPPPSSVDASFLQKSQQDRAKFAETVNKALSSLPKNPPKPIVANKPTIPATHAETKTTQSQAFNSYRPLPARSHSIKSSVLAGLSAEEQEFVNSVTSMGFDMRATIRATQKFGLNREEIVDHLCRVQEISDQGYPINTVQDALEAFENDNKSVIKYLQQASQLIDMGFKEGDVREALKSNDNDQARALDQLMGQT